MSFFHSGSSTLHSSEPDKGAETTCKSRSLRKARSHGSFLSPLVRWARDPAGSLEEIFDGIWGHDVSQESAEQERKEQRMQLLTARMSEATTYDVWRSAAIELDSLEGHDAWKLDEESQLYDHVLIKTRLNQLNEARLSGDACKMLFLLRTALTRSLGNMGHFSLYQHSRIGTKMLIEEYISSTCSTLETLLDILNSPAGRSLQPKTVLEQLLAARQAFGRSALLLSGGGTFGMNHVGVLKTLWEAKLLPRIISGASAGSIVCSVLCTRTDEEIPSVLTEFCHGDLDVFGGVGEDESFLRRAARLAKYGTMFDINHLIRIMRGLLGDLTFQEAYYRTRRILNISVSSASVHELPRLLNYVTSPNVIIWSAVAASCSVPIVFAPVSILAKDPKTGREVPWNPSPQRWIDGSVDNDLPMTRLAEMFNVNHFIVSQVNPHVVPFLDDEDYIYGSDEAEKPLETGAGLLHTMAGFAKSEALYRMHVLAELGIFPTYLTKLRSMLSQKYSGDITILPQIPFTEFPKVLKNPTTEFMLSAMLAGERATWPKLSRVQNHCTIELALDDAVQELRARIAFSPSQVDLRMISLGSSHRERAERRGRTSRRSGSGRAMWNNNEPKRPSMYKERPRSTFELRPTRSLRNKLENSGVKFAPPSPTDSEYESDEDGSSYIKLAIPVKPKPGGGLKVRLPEETEESSDNSNPRSYSPSDEFASPDPPLQTPTLWPSTRRLFPHASQPTTPYSSTTGPRMATSPTELIRTNRSSAPPSSDSLTTVAIVLSMTPANPMGITEAERK